MNYAEIKYYDIANGPGVRVSLFVSGCTHKCPGCFNSVAWPFDYGNPFTEATETEILENLKDDSYQGMTLLGGEPFEPANQRGLIHLLRRYKQAYPQKDLWAFTGYLYDQDLQPGGKAYTEVTGEMLSYIDVLVDGEFRQDLKDITLLFKGSSNQRTIDIPRSRAAKKLVFWKPEDSLTVSRKVHL